MKCLQNYKKNGMGTVFQASQHNRGTAILLRNKHGIISFRKSDDSKILLINVKVDDQIMTIMNVYAPKNVNERKPLFTKIPKCID